MLDVKYLIEADDIINALDRPLSSYDRRTEREHKFANRSFFSLQAEGDARSAQALLDALSMKPIAQGVALWDVNPELDCYGLFDIDRLHQDFNGITMHLIECLLLWIDNRHPPSTAESIKGQIQSRLRDLRSYHEAFYPSEGLAAQYTHAEERRGLMKFLPVVLRGLTGVPDAVANLFAGKETHSMDTISISALVTICALCASAACSWHT